MKTHFLFTMRLVALVFLCKTFAQQTQLPDLMPNSPNVEAMQQYGNYPIGHYTGVPSISIPLYTITSGDIQVPITLNYHASGIKVAQEASWVGLGWSLSAGGSLSKQKRSFDDFGHSEPDHNYHFRDPIIELTEDNKNSINLTDDQYLQYFEDSRRDFFPDLYFYNFLGFSGKFIFDDFPKGVSVKRGDGLEFNVQNFGTNDGVQLDDLEWRVKDLKGFTYSFDRPISKDITTSDRWTGPIGFETTISSWLLTKIKSNTNKEVTFDYRHNGRIQTPHFESSNSTFKINSIFAIVDPPLMPPIFGEEPKPYLSHVQDVHFPYDFNSSVILSQEDIDHVSLERINFDKGYVLFITTYRDDLWSNTSSNNKGQKLSRIEVYNTKDVLVKGFEFEYTYVNYTENQSSTLYKKLCLQSVKEYHMDKNGVRINKNPYIFDYTKRPSGISPIAKNSDLVDHWGYWGKVNNKSSILQHTDLDITINNDTQPFVIDDQRHESGTEFSGNYPINDQDVVDSHSYTINLPGHHDLNTEYLSHGVDTTLNKLYSLKSITYPTKGKTAFDFETNRYSNYYKRYSASRFTIDPPHLDLPSGALVTSLPEGPEMPVFGNFQNEKDIYISAYGHDTTTGLSESFTLNYDSRVRLEFSVNNEIIGAQGILKRHDGSVILRFMPCSEYSTSSSFKSIQGVKLPAGNYTIEIQNTSHTALTEFKATYVDYKQFSTTDPETVGEFDYQLGGGLRVKSIKNYDADGTLLETTTYDYTREGYKYEITLPNQTSQPIVQKSSGKLLAPVRYMKAKVYHYSKILELLPGEYTNDKIPVISVTKSFSSSPIIPVASSANGQSIGYDQVTVSKIDGQGNTLGKTVYYYQNQLETVAEYGTSIPNEIHLDNGKLLKQESYNASGVLLSKIENSYSADSYQPFMYGLSRSFAGSEDYDFAECININDCRNDFEDGVKYSDYKIKSEWWHLDETVQTTYDINGANPVTKTVNYQYTNNHSYQPMATIVTTATSQPIITETYYPEDIVTTSALGLENLTDSEKTAIDHLKKDDLHQVGQPIQTATYLDRDNDGQADANELISLQRTNFGTYSNDLVLPKDVETVIGVYNASTNPLETRIEYNAYYANGNVKEVRQTDGIPITYLWGYNSQYPIAKIENATFNDVETAIAGLNTNYNSLSKIVAISNNDDDRTIGYSGKEGNLREALDAIRNYSALSNAMITTYTYDPLIGVTSTTDPKSYTTYYDYDEFNRLKNVKDAEGSILSQNEYYYKGGNN
ncbi:hypothetical protein MHTCC0001_08030 [Flavobacteriaceae bacterium MHTCC 0001]